MQLRDEKKQLCARVSNHIILAFIIHNPVMTGKVVKIILQPANKNCIVMHIFILYFQNANEKTKDAPEKFIMRLC